MPNSLILHADYHDYCCGCGKYLSAYTDRNRNGCFLFYYFTALYTFYTKQENTYSYIIMKKISAHWELQTFSFYCSLFPKNQFICSRSQFIWAAVLWSFCSHMTIWDHKNYVPFHDIDFYWHFVEILLFQFNFSVCSLCNECLGEPNYSIIQWWSVFSFPNDSGLLMPSCLVSIADETSHLKYCCCNLISEFVNNAKSGHVSSITTLCNDWVFSRFVRMWFVNTLLSHGLSQMILVSFYSHNGCSSDAH